MNVWDWKEDRAGSGKTFSWSAIVSIDFGECKQDGSKVGGGTCLKDTCFGVDGIGVSGAG